jgi:hypothetical protein
MGWPDAYRWVEAYAVSVKCDRPKRNAQLDMSWAFLDNSLTMTYFHTGTRTIIGAESFHCPVRDGKEWDQLAMVIRHNCLLP